MSAPSARPDRSDIQEDKDGALSRFPGLGWKPAPPVKGEPWQKTSEEFILMIR